MSAFLPSQAPQVFIHRRKRLAAALGGRTAFVFASGLRARNYPANVYPYRADSHFLYLTGAALPDGVLAVSARSSQLFLEPKAHDDALWHGEMPGFEDMGAATGVDAVRPLSELADVIEAAGEGACTLPSADPLTRAKQAAALGRRWPTTRALGVEDLGPEDAALAEAMVGVRLQHDEAALEHIRTACAATTAAHLAGMAVTRPGLREHNVRAAMEHELSARGTCCAYGSIVTIAGEVLHNTEYHHELGDHDLLLADLGGEHEGWASDVTRTWPVSGTFSPTQRALYEIVLQSQLDAIALVKPGTRYRDIHLAASLTLTRGLVDEGILRGDPEGLVERGAHALFFPHGLGHLLGLDVHDMEDLGDLAGYAQGRTRSTQFGLGYLRLDRDLAPGMVVTIEPGLYAVPAILASPEIAGPFDRDNTLNREALARFGDVRGIRIEDDVLCTPTGHEVLTAAIPKAAQAVENAVGTRG